jgi:hypothetical protein
MKLPWAVFFGVLAAGTLGAEEAGFVPLFNGRDLSGWVNVNCAPETWGVNNGMIHCTGLPTGALRTIRQYENFILELEWRHLQSGGNSGVFIWSSPIASPGVPFLRAIEVQVLDHGFNIPGKNEWYTTHGDVFPIHGSTMKPFGRHNGMRSFPSSERSKGSPEWNHYRILCTNGVLRLEVNGKEVSGGEECNYRKGYIGLESEGAPIDFRNIRVKEFPSSGAPVEMGAPLDQGWRSLFTGVDLRGWRTNTATGEAWRVGGERIVAPPGPAQTLWTEGDFGDAEFVIDCAWSKSATKDKAAVPILVLGDGGAGDLKFRLGGLKPGEWQRFRVLVKGQEASLSGGEQALQREKVSQGFPGRRRLGLENPGPGWEFMNLYVRDL